MANRDGWVDVALAAFVGLIAEVRLIAHADYASALCVASFGACVYFVAHARGRRTQPLTTRTAEIEVKVSGADEATATLARLTDGAEALTQRVAGLCSEIERAHGLGVRLNGRPFESSQEMRSHLTDAINSACGKRAVDLDYNSGPPRPMDPET